MTQATCQTDQTMGSQEIGVGGVIIYARNKAWIRYDHRQCWISCFKFPKDLIPRKRYCSLNVLWRIWPGSQECCRLKKHENHWFKWIVISIKILAADFWTLRSEGRFQNFFSSFFRCFETWCHNWCYNYFFLF